MFILLTHKFFVLIVNVNYDFLLLVLLLSVGMMIEVNIQGLQLIMCI